MKLLDLFAGIGGFSLAAHWMGWETVGFVEWDKYNQKVLAKNFPNTPIHGDITTYHGTLHEADIITGGFPCQPFSNAGKRKGANDSRYLWPKMLRVVREVQPSCVVGENVAGIYSMDNGSVFEQVCADMEGEGYSVQAFRIPACATGAPHRRDRWWFCAVKNPDSSRDGGVQAKRGNREHRNAGPAVQVWATTDTCKKRLAGDQFDRALNQKDAWEQALGSTPKLHENEWWQVAARICGMDDGLPPWVDRHRTNRLKSLGNSIQPQVAYEILKAINLSSL